MMKDKIVEWIDDHKEQLGISDYELKEVEDTSEGHGSNVYIIEGEEKLVFRMSHPSAMDRTPHGAKMLDFLEEQGIPRVPRKVYYEENSSLEPPVLVESFVGNRGLKVAEMSREQMRSFAALLVKIHSIPIQEYNQFFGVKRPEEINIYELFKERFKEYPKRFYEDYLEIVEEPDERVESAFEKTNELVKIIRQFDIGKIPLVVAHADLHGNLRATNNEVYITDWDLGKATTRVQEVTHMFIEEYQKHDEIPYLSELKPFFEKYHTLAGALWAARRLEQEKQKNGEVEKYQKILDERMYRMEEVYSE